MSASRHTYAVVVKKVDALGTNDCTVLLVDETQPGGYAAYGNKRAADEYRREMRRYHPTVDYEVIKLR